METVTHSFTDRDLVGGDLVLDLVNTVTGWNAEPVDWLDGYARLLEWAELAGAVDETTLAALRRGHRSDPQAAVRALTTVRELREHLYRVLTAMTRGEPVAPRHLRGLEKLWREAVAHSRFAVSTEHLRLIPAFEGSGLDYLCHHLALRSVDLLQALPLDRTRVCAGERCGWVFIDRSKAGRRRWCDMATCGNAAKTRRYLERRRARKADRRFGASRS